MIRRLGVLALFCIGALCVAAPSAHSATLAFSPTFASFATSVGGPLATQDFEGYAPNSNLSGVEFLSGISVTTNMDSLIVFSGSGGNVMFGLGGRTTGSARYDIAVSLPYTSLAFDLGSFEFDPNVPSMAKGPGTLTVFFADATSQPYLVYGNPTGAPIFIGLLSDTAITGIRWAEALEGNGGNEETTLDNFRVPARGVTNHVPEPASLILLGAGLAGLAGSRRRRQ